MKSPDRIRAIDDIQHDALHFFVSIKALIGFK